MDIEESVVKRGRGRGRGTRARGRGRGRGRGRAKKAVVVTSEEEASLDLTFDANGSGVGIADETDQSADNVNAVLETSTEDAVMQEMPKDTDAEVVANATTATLLPDIAVGETHNAAATAPVNIVAQTIDMEADISQLEAPTFTTISRGPPEPMLRLKWNHKVNLIGEKVLNPMIHICDQCDKPILHYGRMIPCKHVFCLKCARAEPVKICPRCNDKVVRVEQSGLGTVFMCTHSGSRYGNTGCRRTYLSQRDLQAHINHRHVTQPPPPPPAAIPTPSELKTDLGGPQRKLSESSASVSAIQAPSTLLIQRTPIRSSTNIGTINPPGAVPPSNVQMHSSLTQANLARINSANAQECHQGKVAIHQTLKKSSAAIQSSGHHQTSETVADASYYSSVLNSFGSGAGGGGGGGPPPGSNTTYETQPGQSSQGMQGTWQQQQQYYR